MNTDNLPKKGLEGLKAHFKDDLISGFSVSLIALPLCLGIAIASGVPPLAGLITAIVGGVICSRISGSFVTISGPAAGLIVITLGAAETMGGAGAEMAYGGYPHALGAILIGGLIMALFGVLKVGKVGDYFPSAAVHGMLAAIGIIIIIKQFFPAIGAPSPKGEILEVATEMPHALTEMNLYALGIALVSLAVLIIHPILKNKVIKMIPAPMWVLIFTIPMAAIMGTENLAMVEMPHNLFGEGGFQLPSFAKIGESAFWVAVTGFALVSAIESLLSAKAVDSLDPYKRNSNLDKDLIAMGAGSSLAAAIGGLPMISEIVRSSANINNGAKTQWANFFHGMFLLIYLLIGVVVIEMIPIAALSAMLVFTGFRLASPKEFKHMYQIGLMELEIFIVTLVAVLATDLIIGIAIGILFKYVLLLFKGTKVKELFKSNYGIEVKNNVKTIRLKGSQIFSNYLSLKKKLDSGTGKYNEIVLDFSEATFVDHTVMEHLEDYARIAKMKGKEVHITNIEALNPVSDHPLAARNKKAKAHSYPHLNKRALQVLSFANQWNYRFENRTDELDQWEFYHLSIRRKLIAAEHLVKLWDDNIGYEMADVTTQTGAMSTEDMDKVTVLKIVGLPKVPKFYLQQRGFIDNIQKVFDNEEVAFKELPEFQKQYSVHTDGDHKEVKQFLNAETIQFLAKEKHLFLSGNGNDLLVHLQDKLLNEKEMEALLSIAKKLVGTLTKNEVLFI
ncbi:SulP family inorganic anion transporter [Tenacibaculum aquimarinum]|uniref:SulP family inorganic anion transporter n=1 Tax=Tenacibaculum aquimarinum TaxID=2910675 RepID=UPI001F0AE999|nr:SulP family inorganic anion transporter [Tenacibaculum aquimarinum]MCH3884503.1 SulP family inorganic anion transporter [Tenacibaculum aquimarinum]